MKAPRRARASRSSMMNGAPLSPIHQIGAFWLCDSTAMRGSPRLNRTHILPYDTPHLQLDEPRARANLRAPSCRPLMSTPCPIFGFTVEFEMATTLTSDQLRVMRAAFLEEVIEPRGLTYAERSGGQRWSFVVRSEASQATDADRQAVEAWAQPRREIIAIAVGPLLDLAGAA